MRVFDYTQPTPDTLALTFSINPDLERIAYQPLYPSFAYPLGIYEIFISDERIEAMFAYLAETFLSTHYQETRDWPGYLRENTSLEQMEGWIELLSAHPAVDLQEPLTGSKSRTGSAAWQALFSHQSLSGEHGSDDRLAQQVVEALLSACMHAYPGLLEHAGLPGTFAELLKMTPYRLAVQIYTRWSTEEQLFEVLDILCSAVMSEQMQECMRFCTRAILHRSNLQIEPEYRVLFVDPGDP